MKDNKKEGSPAMDNETKKTIGKRINAALAQKDVKQKELAEYIGFAPNTENTISYWCSGKRTPNAEQIIKISKRLNVSTDYLLGLTDTPAIDPAAESKFEKGVFDAAIRRHGELSQTDMMIEEMSELTKAILKHRRGASDETLNAILEEMADVEIVLDQMKIIFGSCAMHRRMKILRLAGRLRQDCNKNS